MRLGEVFGNILSDGLMESDNPERRRSCIICMHTKALQAFRRVQQQFGTNTQLLQQMEYTHDIEAVSVMHVITS